MNTENISGRKLKKQVLKWLFQDDFEAGLEAVARLPARRVVNPLFSFFYSRDEHVKWRAIVAMGRVVADLADRDMESARVVMRRLLWNMNEESGGIGWGSPQAMGEIMARHSRLADEFASILVSYISTEKNFVEYEMLQRDVLWGIGRLAQVRPEKVKGDADSFVPFLQVGDAVLRGLAVWITGMLKSETARPLLEGLTDDSTRITIYLDGRLRTCCVGELAREALALW